VMTHFFEDTRGLDILIKQALLLHLGTLLAAVIYFRNDILILLRGLRQYKSSDEETQKTLTFLIIATAISGCWGLILLQTLTYISGLFPLPSRFINLLVGCCLLATAYLELRSKHGGYRKAADLNVKDGVLLGIAQGFAAFPGLSRSGLTVSVLLLRKINKFQSLRLSFLLSIPIVLIGNVVLNRRELTLNLESLVGVLVAFVFGLLTIHGLLKLAEKINFGYFVLFFGILTLVSTLTIH